MRETVRGLARQVELLPTVPWFDRSDQCSKVTALIPAVRACNNMCTSLYGCHVLSHLHFKRYGMQFPLLGILKNPLFFWGRPPEIFALRPLFLNRSERVESTT